jgi:hypothetical protein
MWRVSAMSLLLAACTAQEPERWQAVAIDGRPAAGLRLIIRDGKVIGGNDGCNGWSLSDQPGMIVSDAQECPPSATRDAYWTLARGVGATYSRAGGKLVVHTGKHSGVFSRQ